MKASRNQRPVSRTWAFLILNLYLLLRIYKADKGVVLEGRISGLTNKMNCHQRI